MNDRIDAYIDGELTLTELSPEEAREANALRGSIDAVVGQLRGVAIPDLTPQIMSALPDDLYGQRAGKQSRAGWFWRPRTVTFSYRPAFALGALAAAVILFVLLPSQTPPSGIAPVASAPATQDAEMYVQFRLEAPSASDVRLAGSFTDWQPTIQLSETAPGVWSTMVPLDPGVHDYTFLVNGAEWVVDPYATNVEDSFGGMNSRLFLAAPLDAA
jgi:hypothetical protein